MSILVEREPRGEERVNSVEFFGARRRLMPFTEQGKSNSLFCDGGSHDQEAIAILEEDLGILRQEKIFNLSEEDLRRSAAGIQQEIAAKKV